MKYNLPNDQQRVFIVGATGSGKTQAALWQLSQRSFQSKPWVIFDFKYDDLINSIEGTQELSFDDPIPDRPGIYILHPLPDQQDEVETYMMRIWHHENIGVYIDEGYMIGPNNRGFRALLTQGRSKRIPMIVLSQRPVWMDRFVMSESEFFQVFRLQHRKDLAAVNEFIPQDIKRRLPEYHSYYYDVGANRLNVMRPVPDRAAILNTFDMKLRQMKKVV